MRFDESSDRSTWIAASPFGTHAQPKTGANRWQTVAIGVVTGLAVGLGALARYYVSQREPEPVPSVTTAAADDALGTDGAQIEANVLKLLAAGEQSQAEAYLDVAVGLYPNAVEYARLLTVRKSKEAEQLRAAHFDELQEGQRVLFLFAACLRSRFDKETAFYTFNAVRAINPTTPAARCAVCMMRLDSPRGAQASWSQIESNFAELRQLVDAHPHDTILRWMLAVQCRSWNLNAEGARHYRELLKEWKPGPALAHQTYANLLDELGRYQEALVERYQAVKMEPSSWSYDGLGNTLNHLGRYQEGNQAHAAAVQLAPNSSSHWTNWAAGLNGAKEYGEAIKKSQRALELDERQWRAWWMWGQALEGQGDVPGAVAKYRKALAINPRAKFLHARIADLQASSSR